MMDKSIVLSKRLQTLAEMVTKGNRVADVGCDHGFVSIYLIKQGISPKVLAMDVRPGPLTRAREHIAEYGLGEYIETRLSDGLLELRFGEADTLVCAGMGGPLMMKILTGSREKAQELKELILQPQSELPEFRRFLQAEGYETLEENILCEEGKYYFLFRVHYTGAASPIAETETDRLYFKYGKLLLEQRHPVLREYLEYSMQVTKQIKEILSGQDKERARIRLAQVEQELADLKAALEFWK